TNNAEIDGAVVFTNQATIVAQSSPIRFSGTPSFSSSSQINGPFPILLDGNISFDRPVLNTIVELVGGTLNGDVTFTGTTAMMNWSGGQITRSLTIPPGGTLNLIGSANKFFLSGDNSAPAVLTNLGLVRWSSNSQSLYVGYGTRLINGNGGTWRLERDGSPFTYYTGAQSTFLNQGTLIKASGTNNAEIDSTVVFTNQATIVAQTSPIRFSGTAHFSSSSQINGPFPILLDGNISFDRPVLNTIVELVGGTLNGDVTFTGTTAMMNWSGGQITRSLTIPPGGTLNLIGSANKFFLSGDNSAPAVLTNLGLVRWSSNSQSLYVGYGTRLINGNGGTWRLERDGSPFTYYTGAQSTFLNQGTLIKASGTNNAEIDSTVVFTNQATIVAQTSPIRFSGTAHFSSSSQINGPFPILLDGNISFDRPVLNTIVELVGGTLNGDVTFTGTTAMMNWSGGQITRSLTIPPGGTLNLIGSANKFFLSGDNSAPAVLTNLGLVRWSSNSQSLYVGYGTRLINGNGGTWRLERDGSPFTYYTGAQSTFLNQGTLIKASGTNNAEIDSTVVFTNQATIVAQTSPIRFSGTAHFSSSSQINGPFPILLDGNISFDRPVLNTIVELVGGTLNGDVTFTGTTAVMNWSGGQITRSITVPSGGTLNLTGSGNKFLFSGDNGAPAALTNL